MTGFWRNAEVCRTLVLSVLLSILCSAAGLLLGWKTAAFALCTGLLVTGFQLFVTYRRYRRIAALAHEIDRILHGGDLTAIQGSREGELAVLETEVRKMSLTLREHEQQLVADKQFLADSLADISHQLRTPLTSIHLLVTLLSKSGLTDQRRLELLGELRTLLNRIDWLVEALLKISKLDAGTVQLRADEMPLDALLQTACEPLRIPLELRGITLHLQAEGNIRCDRDWTSEAIGNIVKNCMEHTPADGSVTIRAQETALYSEIIITDTGCGIAPEDLPHIFERFYQGKHADPQSFGIGLALARMIVTRQNGTVKAENVPEGGARFILRFYTETV